MFASTFGNRRTGRDGRTLYVLTRPGGLGRSTAHLLVFALLALWGIDFADTYSSGALCAGHDPVSHCLKASYEDPTSLVGSDGIDSPGAARLGARFCGLASIGSTTSDSVIQAKARRSVTLLCIPSRT